MSRKSRVVAPGFAHHITQRGNRQSDVFRDQDDRLQYLKLLRQNSTRCGMWIWAYALMTNHIHAIVVPHSPTALSETFRNTHSAYGSWFNWKYRCSGHLWQGRFYSCVLDEGHLGSAVRYVERNPVRAGIVDRAEDYPWSSARAHVCGRLDFVLDDGLPLAGLIEDWSQWLSANDTSCELEAIRTATAKHLALGSDEFILRLEAELGRPLRPGKRGPKEKAAVEERSEAQGVFEMERQE